MHKMVPAPQSQVVSEVFDKRHKIDLVLVISVLIVVFAGISTLYTQEIVVEGGLGRWWKQLVWFGVGLILCIALRQSNYQVLGMYALPVYGICVLLLIITRLFAPEINGARSWLRFGPISLQASEFAKLATIVLMARFLELKEREMSRIQSLIIPTMIAFVPMMLVVIQPDLGSAFSFAPILLSMLFIAGADIYHISSVLIFTGVSFSIPLFIEYHKITLVGPLSTHLGQMGKESLVPSVRILQKEIWDFISDGVIPERIVGQDHSYLDGIMANQELMQTLEQAAYAVQRNEGGILLIILQNLPLLVGLGIVFTLVGGILFAIRYSQGSSMSALRKLYIPLSVLGLSLLAAVTFHTVYSFKYHQVVRILAFINPEQFPRGHAYQIIASKAAIGSGELLGRGLMQGDMTIGQTPLVPEAFTDFIFTSWSERTGFLGAILIVFALVAIPLRGLQISYESRDRFGSLLASGISFMLFYHIAFNTGIALGLLPVTGIPLSFMSYGGSHMIICMMCLGILLSIYRRKMANPM